MRDNFNMFFLGILLATLSCRSIVFKTSSQDTQVIDKQYVFENDSIRIEYDFWAAGGVMRFTVINKLNIPIYIDWRKSSFLIEGHKFDYWIDSQVATTTSLSSNYNYTGFLGIRSNGLQKGVTTVRKPERITFLPPGSVADYAIYRIVLQNKIPEYSKFRHQKPPFVLSYNQENTPLVFANFLTYSTTEKFTSESYVNNSFYISEINLVKRSTIYGQDYPNTLFLEPTQFYINEGD